MKGLAEVLQRLLSDLDELGAKCALVGGLAVSARTEPRLTRDVDLAVAVGSDGEAEGIVHALMTRGYTPVTAIEQESARRLATVRLTLPGHSLRGFVADLLFASSGIEPEIVAEAETIEVMPGVHARVARAGHLLALKILARDDLTRPQDRGDIQALLREADSLELERARQALQLITQLGFNRNRDLAADLQTCLSGKI